MQLEELIDATRAEIDRLEAELVVRTTTARVAAMLAKRVPDGLLEALSSAVAAGQVLAEVTTSFPSCDEETQKSIAAWLATRDAKLVEDFGDRLLDVVDAAKRAEARDLGRLEALRPQLAALEAVRDERDPPRDAVADGDGAG